MSETTKTKTADQQQADARAGKGGDSGEDEVQQAFDEAAEKGYFGRSPDPTPRENYSLQTPPDAPTPETDEKAAEAVRAENAKISSPARDSK